MKKIKQTFDVVVKPRVAIIGLGHWGPNHARHFSRLADLVAICDSNHHRLQQVGAMYPSALRFECYRKMLDDVPLDAVVVATPTSSHEKIVVDALKRKIHVLCEKPLALDATGARRLTSLAASKQVCLMVGHTFLFNSGIRHLKELMGRKMIGDVYYLHAKRTHYGLFRPDVNVVWDLASHDVAIFNYLLGDMPTEVSAVGFDWLRKGLHDLSFITLHYPKNIAAHIHVGWLDPKKEREIVAVGNKKMIVWQDSVHPGPISIFDRFIIRKKQILHEFGDFQLLPNEGDIVIPKIQLEEPLLVQAKEFIHAIANRVTPLSGALFACEVVHVLEKINESIKNRGKPVVVSKA